MQTEFLKITGMTCGGCTSNVTRALKAVSGVSNVQVSLSTGEATVHYDDRLASSDQLKSAVKNAGYGVNTTNTAQKSQGKGGGCG